jgi:hypothetical protein
MPEQRRQCNSKSMACPAFTFASKGGALTGSRRSIPAMMPGSGNRGRIGMAEIIDGKRVAEEVTGKVKAATAALAAGLTSGQLDGDAFRAALDRVTGVRANAG